MAANNNSGQALLRYWLTGDIALIEWQDGEYIQRSKYTTAEHTCPGERDKTYFDIELLDGEPAPKDLENDIFDILTRYESGAVAKLHAGSLAEAA